MRTRRLAIALVVIGTLVACGGGKKSNTATSSGSSTGSNVSAGSAASDSGSSSPANADAAPSGDDSPVVGADQGGGPAPSGDAPAPPGLKPFAGTYGYHTTGSGSLNGQSQPIDAQTQTTIEDLNDTDQRVTTPSPQLTQVSEMRYASDRVDLLTLQFQGPISKSFNGPVMYAPAPASVGQSWEWSMQSTDTDPTKKTTVTQKSRVDRVETLTIGGQSIDVLVVETDITLSSPPTDLNATGHLTTWVSPVYKLAAKIHSTLNGTYGAFSFSSDTTSELLDLRPH